MDFDPDISPSFALSVSASLWKQDFREYWAVGANKPPEGVAHEDWQHRKLVSWLAKVFVRSAKTLDLYDVDPVELLMLLDRDAEGSLLEDEFLAQCIQLELVDDLDDELENRAERTLQLIPYATRVQSHRARAYLQRVAHCFILGLRTETVIMCGAVLDAALHEHIPDELLRTAGKPNLEYFTLKHRIDYLAGSRQLTQPLIKKAKQVARERNDAVHNAPGTTVDPLRCLGDLADVLEALFPGDTKPIVELRGA